MSKHANITHDQTYIFEDLVFTSPLLKKEVKLGHAGIVDHFIYFVNTDKNNKLFFWYKAIIANTSARRQHAALPPTQYHLLVASRSKNKRAIYRNAYLRKKYWWHFMKKGQLNGPIEGKGKGPARR